MNFANSVGCVVLQTEEERAELAQRGGDLKDTIAGLEAEMHSRERELVPELSLIPNASHHDSVGVGSCKGLSTVQRCPAHLRHLCPPC